MANQVIHSQISSLNSNIVHKFINTDTLLSPLDTTSTFKSFETIGKNIYISFRGAVRSHTEGEIFLQIPEGYRPPGDRYFVLMIGATSGIGKMESNGDVSIWSTSPPSGRIACMLSYCSE